MGGGFGLDSVGTYGVHDGVMRTSELAGRAGVNGETLRYYERRGLLDEPPRTSGGYRDYPDAAVELLRFIKRAQELGFGLDEVEELLHLDSGGPEGCDTARALAEARKADLEARIADLQRMRDSLAELVATCDLPRADRSCPRPAPAHRQRPEPGDRRIGPRHHGGAGGAARAGRDPARPRRRDRGRLPVLRDPHPAPGADR